LIQYATGHHLLYMVSMHIGSYNSGYSSYPHPCPIKHLCDMAAFRTSYGHWAPRRPWYLH